MIFILQARRGYEDKMEQKGPELASPHKNSGTANCRTTVIKKDWKLPKVIFYLQRQDKMAECYTCDIIKSHTRQVSETQTGK